jgi:hypothetical protein
MYIEEKQNSISSFIEWHLTISLILAVLLRSKDGGFVVIRAERPGSVRARNGLFTPAI